MIEGAAKFSDPNGPVGILHNPLQSRRKAIKHIPKFKHNRDGNAPARTHYCLTTKAFRWPDVRSDNYGSHDQLYVRLSCTEQRLLRRR